MCSASQLNTIVKNIAQCAITVFGNKLSSTVLYGSYARGDFDAKSDIDIMILIQKYSGIISSFRESGMKTKITKSSLFMIHII